MGRGSHDKHHKIVKNYYETKLQNKASNFKFVIDDSIPIDEYVSIDLSQENLASKKINISSSKESIMSVFKTLNPVCFMDCLSCCVPKLSQN